MALLPEPIPVHVLSPFSQAFSKMRMKAYAETHLGASGLRFKENLIKAFIEYVRSQDEICCGRPEPSPEGIVVAWWKKQKHRHIAGLPQGRLYPKLKRRSHESAYLAEVTCHYITDKDADLNLIQKKALQRWEKVKNELMDSMAIKDASLIADGHGIIQSVISIFNDLFLLGALRRVKFDWIREAEGVPDMALGYGSDSSIQLHPTSLNSDPEVSLAVSRLSTLLHEMIHAFLAQFTCSSCKKLWHGRDWQVLAKRIEEVAPGLLGFRAALGRFDGLIYDLKHGIEKLPSMHDVLHYNFEQVLPTDELYGEGAPSKLVEDIPTKLVKSRRLSW
ncbi:uncharacterized protein BDZ99DRAFT_555839 [Mytilinidion resinicola]|uniref:SprT-like domain-containing protein n=1 Tax=Mytilinidion resinicola TaxID=574789 RepID=A0A6A6YY59_9PEZI|nr:uncharacterized protein BDZ99DRAFT_555839 [Mytilinidion resinicola]KAF2812877.1 hypothetical protein BDZ99DRAFT_555839 [Mytilinidion resinicola]